MPSQSVTEEVGTKQDTPNPTQTATVDSEQQPRREEGYHSGDVSKDAGIDELTEEDDSKDEESKDEDMGESTRKIVVSAREDESKEANTNEEGGTIAQNSTTGRTDRPLHRRGNEDAARSPQNKQRNQKFFSLTLHPISRQNDDGSNDRRGYGLKLSQNRKGMPVVSEIVPGGSAETEGSLCVDDVILRVNGDDCQRLTLMQLASVVREASSKNLPLQMDVVPAKDFDDKEEEGLPRKETNEKDSESQETASSGNTHQVSPPTSTADPTEQTRQQGSRPGDVSSQGNTRPAIPPTPALEPTEQRREQGSQLGNASDQEAASRGNTRPASPPTAALDPTEKKRRRKEDTQPGVALAQETPNRDYTRSPGLDPTKQKRRIESGQSEHALETGPLPVPLLQQAAAGASSDVLSIYPPPQRTAPDPAMDVFRLDPKTLKAKDFYELRGSAKTTLFAFALGIDTKYDDPTKLPTIENAVKVRIVNRKSIIPDSKALREELGRRCKLYNFSVPKCKNWTSPRLREWLLENTIPVTFSLAGEEEKNWVEEEIERYTNEVDRKLFEAGKGGVMDKLRMRLYEAALHDEVREAFYCDFAMDSTAYFDAVASMFNNQKVILHSVEFNGLHDFFVQPRALYPPVQGDKFLTGDAVKIRLKEAAAKTALAKHNWEESHKVMGNLRRQRSEYEDSDVDSEVGMDDDRMDFVQDLGCRVHIGYFWARADQLGVLSSVLEELNSKESKDEDKQNYEKKNEEKQSYEKKNEDKQSYEKNEGINAKDSMNLSSEKLLDMLEGRLRSAEGKELRAERRAVRESVQNLTTRMLEAQKCANEVRSQPALYKEAAVVVDSAKQLVEEAKADLKAANDRLAAWDAIEEAAKSSRRKRKDGGGGENLLVCANGLAVWAKL